MKKFLKFIIPTILILGPAIWMTKSALDQNSISCEVCMKFNGKMRCSNAAGETKQACARTGTDNACGLLASGVQQSIQCSQKEPFSLTYP